jgi:hypothetical protein
VRALIGISSLDFELYLEEEEDEETYIFLIGVSLGGLCLGI